MVAKPVHLLAGEEEPLGERRVGGALGRVVGDRVDQRLEARAPARRRRRRAGRPRSPGCAPALSPATAIRSGSAPSARGLGVRPTRTPPASRRRRPGRGARARGGSRPRARAPGTSRRGSGTAGRGCRGRRSRARRRGSRRSAAPARTARPARRAAPRSAPPGPGSRARSTRSTSIRRPRKSRASRRRRARTSSTGAGSKPPVSCSSLSASWTCGSSVWPSITIGGRRAGARPPSGSAATPRAKRPPPSRRARSSGPGYPGGRCETRKPRVDRERKQRAGRPRPPVSCEAPPNGAASELNLRSSAMSQLDYARGGPCFKHTPGAQRRRTRRRRPGCVSHAHIQPDNAVGLVPDVERVIAGSAASSRSIAGRSSRAKTAFASTG